MRKFQTCAMLLTVCIKARVSLAPLAVSSYEKVSLDLKKDNRQRAYRGDVRVISRGITV